MRILREYAAFAAVLIACCQVWTVAAAAATAIPRPAPEGAVGLAVGVSGSSLRESPALASGAMALYDNTGNTNTSYYAGQSGQEAIDDLHGVTTGVLSGIAFEYEDPSTAAGTITAYVTIYSNTRGLDAGIEPIAGPYLVEDLPRGRQFFSFEIEDGPEIGPDIWLGVRFDSRTAGLAIREEPRIGFSHDYYVENGNFFFFRGDPQANFAVRVAVEEPPERVVLIALGDRSDDPRTDEIHRIDDLESGVATFVGTFGQNFERPRSLAVLPTNEPPTLWNALFRNRLFVADQDRLLEVDRPTGNGYVAGPFGEPGVTGLAFHPQQQLFGVTSETHRLLTINPVNGRSEVVGKLDLDGHIRDLAFHPDGRAFVLMEGGMVIHQIDAASGRVLGKWQGEARRPLRALLWSLDGLSLHAVMQVDGEHHLVSLELPRQSSRVEIVFISREPLGLTVVESLAWLSESTLPTLMDANTAAETLVPSRVRLLPNRPNPFNPQTQIDFDLKEPGRVRINVFDVRGRQVAQLLDAWRQAGRHHVRWDGRSNHGEWLGSGVYFCRLRVGDEEQRIPMTLVR